MTTLNYTLGEKGFPAFVHHNIEELTTDQLRELVELILTYAVVVFRDQNLDADQQVNVCRKFGTCPEVESVMPESYRVNKNIIRVSGKRDSTNGTGLFPFKKEIEWHTDSAVSTERGSLHWVYGVEGTKGSCTSWMNTALVYKHLPDEYKHKLTGKKIYCGYWKGSTSGNINDTGFHTNENNPLDPIITNRFGVTSLFFPFYQIGKVKGINDVELQEIKNFLIEFSTREDFVYDHYWQDNDLVISDQWSSLHKRWNFEKIDERTCYRILFNYDKVCPNDAT